METLTRINADGLLKTREIRNLTQDELDEARLRIQHDANNVRSQLEAARAKAHETGEYAQADWFRRANNALRFKGECLQAIQAEQARRTAAKKQENIRRAEAEHSGFTAHFLNIAKTFLPEGVYDQWTEEASRRAKDEIDKNGAGVTEGRA